MADISTYLAKIQEATYGEEVRGSIHDAIQIINQVGEVVLTTGTAVDSETSSSTGFYENSLYLNITTMELWKCMGTNLWASQGVLKGNPGEAGISPTASVSKSGDISTLTVTDASGTTSTEIKDGTNGDNGNRWFRGIAVSGTSVNPTQFTLTMKVNEGDNYINTGTDAGAVYHCTQGAEANSPSLWAYDFTMTGGGGGSSLWGAITGTLSDQTDLNTALAAKLNTSDEYITGVTSDLDVTNHELGLAASTTAKLSKLDGMDNQISGTVSGSTATFTDTTYIGGSTDYLLDVYCSDGDRYIKSQSISGNTLTVTFDDSVASATCVCVATKKGV